VRGRGGMPRGNRHSSRLQRETREGRWRAGTAVECVPEWGRAATGASSSGAGAKRGRETARTCARRHDVRVHTQGHVVVRQVPVWEADGEVVHWQRATRRGAR